MAEEDDCGSAVAERRRRYWKREEKRRIVAESFKDGGSVAEVARRYGLNANLLFTWRRQLAAAAGQEPPAIRPVTISLMPALATTERPPAGPDARRSRFPQERRSLSPADARAAAEQGRGGRERLGLLRAAAAFGCETAFRPRLRRKRRVL